MIGIRWERDLHQAPTAAGLAVVAGRIVVHERGTRLVCLDPADGAVLWDVPVGTWPRAVVIAGNRCLVIPQSTGELVCVGLDSGSRLWTVENSWLTGHLVVSGDTVLVGGWRGYTPLRAFDIESGQLRWETTDRLNTVRPAPTSEGFLVAEPAGTTVSLLALGDGRRVRSWTLPYPASEADHEPVFAVTEPDRVFVRCGRRSVVELAGGVAREVVRADEDLSVAAPHILDGRLWLHEVDGGYTVADSLSGRLLWRVDCGERLVDQVVPLGAGFLVAGASGVLFELDSHGRVLRRAAVARRIRALRGLPGAGVLVVAKGSLIAGTQAGGEDQGDEHGGDGHHRDGGGGGGGLGEGAGEGGADALHGEHSG